MDLEEAQIKLQQDEKRRKTKQKELLQFEVQSQPEGRVRKFTEKGRLFEMNLLKQRFRGAVTVWRKHANKLDSLLLEEEINIPVLKDQKQLLYDSMQRLENCFENLQINRIDEEHQKTYDVIEEEHRELMRKIREYVEISRSPSVSQFGVDKSNTSSKSRKSSHISFVDVNRDQSSVHSSSASAARIKSAELRADLENIDMITSKKAEIEKLKAEIAKVNIRKKLLVAEAELQAENPEYIQKTDPIKPVMSSSVHGKPDANEKQNQLNSSTESHDSLTNMMKVMMEEVSISRLPPPEPRMFSGDPLKYPEWISSFETLIAAKGIKPSEKLHYLKRYLTGEAKEAVNGLFMLQSTDAYDKAKEILQKRFGNQFLVADSFRNKLEQWPKISSRDGKGIRKLSDFLNQCAVAMLSMPGLKILEDERENRKILSKLPDWMVNRWSRIAADHKDVHQSYPSFDKFVKFMTKEADIANDPITSVISIKSTSTAGKSLTPARSFQTQIKEGKDKKPTESTSTQPRPKTCAKCKGSHSISLCESFAAMPSEDRVDFVRKNDLCFGCLGYTHKSKDCRTRHICKVCHKKHPTAFHGTWKKPEKNESEENPRNETASGSSAANGEETKPKVCGYVSSPQENAKCSMIVPVYVSHPKNPDKEILIYAMLDTQSDTTFLLDDVFENLECGGVETKLLLSTMASEKQEIVSRKINGLVVRGCNSETQIPLPSTYTRQFIPANKDHIPTPQKARQWPHLERISTNLLPLEDIPVGLLIGYNCPKALFPQEIFPPVDDGPYGQKTVLGWGIVGMLSPDSYTEETGVSHRLVTLNSSLENQQSVTFAVKTKVKEMISPSQVLDVLEKDFIGPKESTFPKSRDDQKFIDIIDKEIHQTENGNYEMPLPFKTENPTLPNNKSVAIQRLNGLKHRFMRDENYWSQYSTFMENMIKKNYAEKVPIEEIDRNDGHVWYLPHHGVTHPKKKKLRVVFNASATYQNASLNNNLLQGPDFMNGLTGVLCRFRKEPIAIACDIEQMFLQFRINPEHRDYVRFLWFEENDYKCQPIELRMCVHLFGAVSSPACANFSLKRLAEDYEEKLGENPSNFLRRNFYVDDGLVSVSNIPEAIDLVKSTQELCCKANIRLHKFVSNCEEVLQALPQKDVAENLSNKNLINDSILNERTLGIEWDVKNDQFNFTVQMKETPTTRRGILSAIGSIYDPLGLIAPFILGGKQILQELCQEQLDWDDKIPSHLETEWKNWKASFASLGKLIIPRCYKPENFGEILEIQIHHFSDASTKGYGQCSYIRLVSTTGNIHCSLLFGKSRVAPLKPVTVPRLELSAAVLSVKVSKLLQEELDYKDYKEFFWTDSTVVLGYISNDARKFQTFVANRIQQIRDHTEVKDWNYVPSKENPADYASRGIKFEDNQKNQWFNGPEFLWKPEIPTFETSTDSSPLPEIRKTCFSTQIEDCKEDISSRFEKFSSWYKLKRAIAVCLKYKKILKERISNSKETKVGDRKYQPVTVSEMQIAEKEIFKIEQQRYFSSDLQKAPRVSEDETEERRSKNMNKESLLYRLDPFKDSDGILRVGGRLVKSDLPTDIKHPMILPKDSHVSMLVTRHHHERFGHQGKAMTVNSIRRAGIWIIACAYLTYKVIRDCVTCHRLFSKAESQKMTDLPPERLKAETPFTYSGMDVFGPWYIKQNRKELKRYGILFTCMSSRAVHIEVADSLSTDSFLLALRRFVALRGPIRTLRCDNGTNFVGANSELKKALEEMDLHTLHQYLAKEDCEIEFLFNTPKASHHGGVWERQIRSVRRILNALLEQHGRQLTEDSLRTLMYEAATIINCSPLTVEDINDPSSMPLSPHHLLTGKSSVVMPPPGNFVKEDLYLRKQWRRVQYLTDIFWSKWKQEFLQSLQKRSKWIQPQRNLRVDVLVLIVDENLPRNCWKLGRVSETSIDDDRCVRKVKVAVASRSLDKDGKRREEISYLERPIQKLVLVLGQD